MLKQNLLENTIEKFLVVSPIQTILIIIFV